MLINFLADYNKFGMIKQIYMPQGLVWLDGLNNGAPIRIDNRDPNSRVYTKYTPNYGNEANMIHPSQPFNYR